MMTALRRRREGDRHDQLDRIPNWAETADRLFADAFHGLAEDLRAFASGVGERLPATLTDDDDTWRWRVDVPDGIRRRDLEVTVDGDRVVVTAERRPRRFGRQRRHQRWEAAVRLPARIDDQDVSAGMRGRHLEVIVPKPPRLRRVRIPIRAGEPR